MHCDPTRTDLRTTRIIYLIQQSDLMMEVRCHLQIWRELDQATCLALNKIKFYLAEVRVQKKVDFKEAGLSLPSLKKAHREKKEYSLSRKSQLTAKIPFQDPLLPLKTR